MRQSSTGLIGVKWKYLLEKWSLHIFFFAVNEQKEPSERLDYSNSLAFAVP
jgi:hypothetical protein